MKCVLLPLMVVVLAGCESVPVPPAPSPPDTKTLEGEYSAWASVTEKPYAVPKTTYTICDYRVSSVPGWDPEFVGHMHNDGRGPHKDYAVNVRVNPIGLEAFSSRTPVPVGTVVVKEKMTGGKVMAVGTMTKREPGYDPEYGDWEYGYRELKADAAPPTAGKIESCIACHRIAAKKDFLFRTYLPHK